MFYLHSRVLFCTVAVEKTCPTLDCIFLSLSYNVVLTRSQQKRRQVLKFPAKRWETLGNQLCHQLESVIIKPIKDKRSGLPEEIRQPGRKRIPLLDDYKELNEILVRLFRSIMDVEEKAIITREFQDITNNDMHVIEAIGIGTPKNMSSIAKKLSVTVGTLTIAMNSLVKKGYVKRERGEEDRRVVYISLSDKGKKAFVHHARFHKEMITSIMDEFDDDEKKILIRGLTKLDNWFKDKEEENKKNRE